MKTLNQEFAASVYERVEKFADKYPDVESEERKKYGGMAHKLPVLIHTAGLAQALAFVESRGHDIHQVLLEDLAQVVVNDQADEYLKQSRNEELPEYIFLTRKTMIALSWYKRFAQSVLGVASTEEGEGT
jgi:CRISPR-associated protein Cmr5